VYDDEMLNGRRRSPYYCAALTTSHDFLLCLQTVLVRYSDGSIRIQPSLYQLLLENNPEEDFLHHHHILKNDYSAGGSKASCSVSPNGSMDHQLLLGVMTPPRGAKQTTTTTTVTRTGGTASALDDFARFEDDVFRTLDTVASSVPASAVPSSSSSFCSSAEDEGGEESALASSSSSCASNAAQQLCSNIITIDNNDFSPSLEEFEKHQEHLLKEENDILEQMVLQERMALEEELQAANMEARHKSNDDNYRMAQQQLREQTCQVEAATHAEAKECQRLEFLVLAQQVRLLRELRSIYPIRRRSRVAPPLSRGAAQPSNSSASSDNDAFTIRGLPIPHPGVDLFAGTTMTTSYFAVGGSSSSEGGVPAIISEDDLSAALGYLCHVVFMLSKYLSIPLRYRLICNSSRSAVQEVDCHSDVAGGVSPVSSIPFSSGNNSGGGGATSGNKKPLLFPLFQARPIEREQVEHGVMLLERNVECLCKARGIRFDPHSHVLTKVNRIFECIVDGKP
jgi:Vacuolar sorting 38 and autophagy-related subunit 14